MNDKPQKKLKLSFAMGGGVSLGAFSGAALTESLKLLLVGGLDDEGQRYTHIELDSMSGASAGAISLCIMLSSLLNYKRYLSTLDKLPDNKFRLADIDLDLTNQFGADWKTTHAKNIEPLRALQLSQRLQEKLWVEKINMQELMRINDFDPSKKDGFSLLNRNLLVELVNEFILADLEQVNAGDAHIITENHFLFACSLTNMIPLPLGNIDSPDDPPPPLVRELRKAHASYNHKELRVFDFQLNTNKKRTPKLLKSVPIENHDNATHHVASPKTWSMIASTCLACGAFPFAFEPVALKRYVYEYIEPAAMSISEDQSSESDTPEEDYFEINFEPEFREIENEENVAVFQSDYKANYSEKVKQFVKTYSGKGRIKKSTGLSPEHATTDDDEESIQGDEEFLFSYIDGGTLNNEPIREAFRLANYIDSRDPAPRESYDRIILFVDPIVRTDVIGHNSTDYDKYAVSERFNRLRIKQNTEMNRLSSYTGKILRTLRDQGSIKEEHKISTYLATIKLNQKLAKLIAHNPFDGDFTIDFMETFFEFLNYQDRNNNDEQISTFNVNDRSFIKYAIKRYTKTYELSINYKILLHYFTDLLEEGVKIQQKQTTFQDSIDILNVKVAPDYKPILKKMIYDLLLQMILNTDGKDPEALRMAITPVQYPVEFNQPAVTLKTIELPGEEFQAFGGFVSQPARAFSNEYGRYCAYKTLTKGDFRRYYQHVMNDTKVDHTNLLVEHTEMERAYRNKLISLSPLNKTERANKYWKEVRADIFYLMKRRIKKSINPFFSSSVFIGGVASLSFVLFAPWYLAHTYGFNGALTQVIMLIVALIIGYIVINHQIVKQLKTSFYNHQISSFKLQLIFPNGNKNATHFRFNNEGKYNRLFREKNNCLLPIPFYLKRDPSAAESDIDSIEVKLIPHQKVPKKFKYVFSTLESDIEMELDSIQLYRRRFIFYMQAVGYTINIEDLKTEPKLKALEQRISPIVTCTIDNDGHASFDLIECAVPLEETIVLYHQNQHQA